MIGASSRGLSNVISSHFERAEYFCAGLPCYLSFADLPMGCVVACLPVVVGSFESFADLGMFGIRGWRQSHCGVASRSFADPRMLGIRCFSLPVVVPLKLSVISIGLCVPNAPHATTWGPPHETCEVRRGPGRWQRRPSFPSLRTSAASSSTRRFRVSTASAHTSVSDATAFRPAEGDGGDVAAHAVLAPEALPHLAQVARVKGWIAPGLFKIGEKMEAKLGTALGIGALFATQPGLAEAELLKLPPHMPATESMKCLSV